jgi:hypothetical protein
MKIFSRVLAVLFVLNAIMALTGMIIRGGLFQSSPFNMLAILAVPLCLFGVGFLQWVRPSAALLVLSVALFPYCCIVCHAFLLPIWPFFRLLPREAHSVGFFVSNITAVMASLLVWIGMRRKPHNKEMHDIFA